MNGATGTNLARPNPYATLSNNQLHDTYMYHVSNQQQAWEDSKTMVDRYRKCNVCHTERICTLIRGHGWLCDECVEDYRQYLIRQIRHKVTKDPRLRRKYPHYAKNVLDAPVNYWDEIMGSR